MNQPTPPPTEPGPYSKMEQPQPVSVEVKLSGRKPVVTFTMMGITIAIFLVQMLGESVLGGDVAAFLGMKINEYILVGELWRLITPVLLHGSIAHLALNMYALYVFGPGLEYHYGHGRFLGLFLLAGFAGNVMSFLFSTNPSLGSSTSIFGLLAAEGVFLYQNRKMLGAQAQRALMNIVLVAVLNLAIGMGSGLQIDNWGHIGGLIGGFIFSWFGGPRLGITGTYPDLAVGDQRRPPEVWGAALATFMFFALLVGVKFYLYYFLS